MGGNGRVISLKFDSFYPLSTFLHSVYSLDFIRINHKLNNKIPLKFIFASHLPSRVIADIKLANSDKDTGKIPILRFPNKNSSVFFCFLTQPKNMPIPAEMHSTKLKIT